MTEKKGISSSSLKIKDFLSLVECKEEEEEESKGGGCGYHIRERGHQLDDKSL